MPTKNRADSDDYFYKILRKKQYEMYWTTISKIFGINLDDVSEEFLHLVTTMLKFDYKKRFSIDQIKEHAWMQKEIATEAEVKAELAKRKAEIKMRLNQEDSSDAEGTTADGNTIDPSIFSDAFDETERGDGDNWEEEDGIRDPLWSRGLGDVYKRQPQNPASIKQKTNCSFSLFWVGIVEPTAEFSKGLIG